MYFAAWSHNVVSAVVQLSMDLKLGEYLKIPPRVMFLTQIYGTVLGGFINYVVMISIVSGNKELLADRNGNSSWSGAAIQSYNTNASSWALAANLYKQGAAYSIVPFGLLIGAGMVVMHRIIVQVCTVSSFLSVRSATSANPIPVRTQGRQVFPPRDQLPTIPHVRGAYSI